MAFAIRSHFLSSICGESSISCLRVSVILRLSCLLDTSLNTLGWAAKRLFSSAVSSWKKIKNWQSWKTLQKKQYLGFPVLYGNLYCPYAFAFSKSFFCTVGFATICKICQIYYILIVLRVRLLCCHDSSERISPKKCQGMPFC